MRNYPVPDGPVWHVHDDGVNAPMDHQRVISQLNVGLGKLYYYDKAIALEPLPETMIDEGQTSPTPDLVLYDPVTELMPIIIEVCHTRGQNNDLKKVIRLIEDDDYGIQEGFVYNYRTNEWLRYRKGDGGVASASSISELVGLDLAQFLNL
ncbi:hypothetical protein [Fibrella aquatilis]|uniref:Uncharacterized protein n=1 Tax=Fibrella aquatilis TaxID=2817059 RepID=A0A939K3S9_9BACT|nr:hypothetical protein [Fibrella aquatilis]MBO0934660.1 hypothetical protein [Fibrella aquatilis]